MFHGISTWLLVWFFPTSVFGVGIFFLIAPFLIFAYLYLFTNFNTLTQELDGTRAYQETDTDEISVVNAHLNELPVKFSDYVNEAKTRFLPFIVYLSFTKDRTKLDLLLILVLVLPLNFLNYNFLSYCYQISCHTIL